MKIDESVLDEGTLLLISNSGGLVVIKRDSAIIVWSKIPGILRGLGYHDDEFYRDFSSKNPDACRPDLLQCAVAAARKILSDAQTQFGKGVELGRFIHAGKVMRIEFSNGRWGEKGSIAPTRYEIA